MQSASSLRKRRFLTGEPAQKRKSGQYAGCDGIDLADPGTDAATDMDRVG